MRRDYDIVEELPDGSRIWRACVTGRFEAHRKIVDLTEHSENDFLVLDAENGEPVLPIVGNRMLNDAATKIAAD